MLYATSNGDGKVYESADGEKWNESTMFGEGVELLLATLTNNDVSRICYIKKGADNQRYFYYQTNDVPKETLDKAENGGKVPSKFPTKNISYTVYKSSTNINSVLLVGDTETATLADDSKLETTIVWDMTETNGLSSQLLPLLHTALNTLNHLLYIIMT